MTVPVSHPPRPLGHRTNATGPWVRVVGKRPALQAGQSYLIYADYDGIRTCDVAFYQGKRADGSDWWVMGNIEIDPSCIECVAEILYPEPIS